MAFSCHSNECHTASFILLNGIQFAVILLNGIQLAVILLNGILLSFILLNFKQPVSFP
jgi:hypothetical protein